MPVCLSTAHRSLRLGVESRFWSYSAHLRRQAINQPRQQQCLRESRRRVHSSLNVGTICIQHNHDADISDILNNVPLVNGSKSSAKETDQSLLLLVTPGLARVVKDGSLPVQITQRVLGRLPKVLESVTGVIDALPAHGKGAETCEGIAYVLCPRESTPLLLTSTQLRSAANKPGSLTFNLSVATGAASRPWEVQLPLAQTIFSTGLTSTLIHRVHERTSTGDTLHLIGERYLESLTIQMPDSSALRPSLDHFPLLPLTSCQIIKNSMGNIIRTVTPLQTSADSPAEEEPASRRLEGAVSAFFKALAISPEPVNVWALIIPKAIVSHHSGLEQLEDIIAISTERLAKLWSAQADQQQATQQYAAHLIKLLESGGRLVKVLSGGGGWGKKAGLLSLDPDLEYSTRELRDDFGWSFDFDAYENDDEANSIEKDLDQALGNSAEDGDGLIFMIAHQQQQQHNGQPSGSITSRAASQDLEIILGNCTPREETALHQASRYDSGKAGDVSIVAHAGSFGILSETGLAVKVSKNGKLVGQSKLEVPGLSLVVRESG